MKIYNTMTRTKETFVPLTPGAVGMYVCGVTPYDYSHIGHARSALAFDVVRRYLTFRGFRVTFVRNFTDVDDKIIQRAAAEGVSPREVSERFIAAEQEDMASLGILPSDVAPRATEHVGQMIELIERLLAAGTAYVVEGDVYFEIARFPAYGRLSGKPLDELLSGARVEVDDRKRDPRDFALWKGAKPGEPAWDSPWGPGRPGWHIECSAMAMQYLGPSFDLHGGGEDLVFPHHECEIAQAESATGEVFARYWMHNGLVNMRREKMSKSLGNTLAIRDLVRRHDPRALRLYLLGTHYRNPLEWSEGRARESARALERFTRLRQDAERLRPASPPTPAVDPQMAEFRRRFETAMDDDFNTPQALGVLFDMARSLAERRDAGPAGAAGFVGGVDELVSLAGTLGLFVPAGAPAGPPGEVQRLVEERAEARRRRDWSRSDQIRDHLRELGWTVEDTPTGPRLVQGTAR